MVTFLGLAAIVLVPATAYASPPTTASGEMITLSMQPQGIRLAGGNMIIESISSGEMLGDIEGSWTAEGKMIIHPNGKVTSQAIMVVSPCTVAGRSGTLTMQAIATGEGVLVQGSGVILHGTGELSNLHGQGTWESIEGVGGSYSMKIHFERD